MTLDTVKARPKLLFLSQTLPFPPDGGVKIRTYNILRLLARTFDVTALCFYRSKSNRFDIDLPATIRGLEPLARVEAFPIPQEHSHSRLLWDHLRSVLSRRAYTVYSYQSRDFEDRLKHLLKSEHFDLVHADSLDLSFYFPLLGDLRLACTHHDAQSSLLARRALLEESLLRRGYISHQARLMRKEEQLWCPKVSLNVPVSDLDATRLAQVAPSASFLVMPNGVDTEFFKPQAPRQTEGIVFVGGTTWYPNKDALEYFATEILPKLRRRGFHARVLWVGRASSEEIARYRRDHGIEMTGYVADVRPLVQSAACYVVPIRLGGGTRVKILDAWAMGVPIVSTTIGAEGLGATDGQDILIRDDPESFAEAVLRVLTNRDLGARIGDGGRRTAEQRFSWDALEATLRDAYLGLLDIDSAPSTLP